jgi:hypothetical protein
MKIQFHALLLAFAFTVGHCSAQGTLQITFDGPPVQPPGSDYGVIGYYESGMLFTATNPATHNNTFSRSGGGISYFPDNGTAYLQPGPSTLMFSFTNGIVFGLVSVDLAEWSTDYSNESATVLFIGYQQGGLTVTNVFTTDGIIDGTGPLADFQTFNFTNFTDLVRVEIPGPPDPSGWALDNLVLSIPEPTSGVLLLAGGLMLGALKLCKRRRR